MIVIDASVVLAWYFPDEGTRTLVQLLDEVVARGAFVPVHWRAEVANAFAMGVRHERFTADFRRRSLTELAKLRIETDEESKVQLWQATQDICDQFRLTAYDASYLELALRRRLPLATLDRALAKAGVSFRCVAEDLGYLMDLLRDNELIYGRLLTVEEPHLIGRYNKALQAFGLKPSALEQFDIDRSGFSPQVAEELGDPLYLDPNEVNRRFIILTPAQADLPVVHTAFSNTSDLLHEFFARNSRAIDALTIKDVIYGEIEDSVSKVDDIEDLLSINQVEFRVLSAEDVLGKAAELGKLTDRLKQEPDAWRDDAMLTRMVELAKVCGDIRENALVPDQVIFRHNAFWTSHFGGLYVFIDPGVTTVIADPAAPGFRRSRPWQVSYLSIGDPERVFKFLASTGRIDLPRASWIEASGYLEHRADMTLRAIIHEAEPGRDLRMADTVWLQTWLHANAERVARDGTFPFLNAAKREIVQYGQMKLEDVTPANRFLVVRARPDHPDAWLTTRLIADFVPRDFVSRYVFNKQGFYKDFEAFPEAWKAHVVEVLKSTYLKDKAAFRARLYGLVD